jgi:hypothetical protein
MLIIMATSGSFNPATMNPASINPISIILPPVSQSIENFSNNDNSLSYNMDYIDYIIIIIFIILFVLVYLRLTRKI